MCTKHTMEVSIVKTKLAIIVPSLGGGGAERVVTNIVRNIDFNKFDITLILIREEGQYINLIPPIIPVINLYSSRVRYSIFKLIKCLNNLKPDVIFSTLGHLNLVLLAIRPFLRFNHKIIIREANTPSQSLKTLNGMKGAIFKHLYAKLYPKADVIVAQCKAMKNDIVNMFSISEHKIIYIYNPLDLEYIRKNMVDKNPYDKDEINILAVGRLTYQKGFDILIDAFKIVENNIPNIHLTILGDGELRQELEQKRNKLGLERKISFKGFKKNPYPYYYYADVYVLSSRWEGFPNALLEALACGCKVVAVDCKSGPREILGDNEFGLLVPPEDPDALAKGIIEAINSENKSKDRAKDFDVKNVIKEYEKLFERTKI